MTVTTPRVTSRTGARASRGRSIGDPGAVPPVPVICPYLIAEDGSWRSVRPSREHRCGAVAPAAALALDKQRRLCLARAHSTCATRIAALASGARTSVDAPINEPQAAPHRARATPSPGRDGTTRWALVRTAPVVLDRSVGSRTSAGRTQRQWAFGALMALALGALVVARLPEPATRSGSAHAVLAVTAEPAAAAGRVAGARPPSTRARGFDSVRRGPAAALASPPGTAGPTSRPSRRTTPAVHVVVAGETLSALAREYGTTVAALQAANDLGGSTTLRIGQRLTLP